MKQVALRVDAKMFDEINDIVIQLSDDPYVRVDRSAILRDALSKGWPLVRDELKKRIDNK